MRNAYVKTALVCILTISMFYCVAQDPVEVYIRTYRDLAVIEMERTGIPASIKLGQAILESNAGQSDLASKSNNHFGIKCGSSWSGKTAYKKDDDYVNGKLKKSCFRAYPKSKDSFVDHSNFLKDPRKDGRYGFLFELDPKDYKKWAKGLKKAGYATAPNYHKQLINIIEKYNLHKYDDWGVEVSQLNLDEEEADVEPLASSGKSSPFLYNNDVKYVVAKANETVGEVAARTKTDAERIIRYNEGLKSSKEKLSSGERVYLQPKRNSYRGRRKWHEVKKGETMYIISQAYGLRLDFLYQRNAMQKGQEPAPGQQIKINGSPVASPPVLAGSQTLQPPGSNPSSNILEMGEEIIELSNEEKPKENRPIIPVLEEEPPIDPRQEIVSQKPSPKTKENSINTSAPIATQQTNRPKPEGLPIVSMNNDEPKVKKDVKYYFVQAGDTLWNISKRFNISISQIVEWNELKNNTIKLGMRLIVSGKL